MNKLITYLKDYLKFITSTPSDREVKLRAFEQAEAMHTYHRQQAEQHGYAAAVWLNKRERARNEIVELVVPDDHPLSVTM